jgi:hypothetical protein
MHVRESGVSSPEKSAEGDSLGFRPSNRRERRDIPAIFFLRSTA